MQRKFAVYAIGTAIGLISTIVLLNFETLFGLVIVITTRYGQPLLGFMFCIYAGWVWHRDTLLQELRKGNPEVATGLFWRVWPWYVKLVCPAIILAIFAQTLFG